MKSFFNIMYQQASHQASKYQAKRYVAIDIINDKSTLKQIYRLAILPIAVSGMCTLSGCQSSPVDGVNPTRYSTATEPTGRHSVNQEKIAEVRTSMAAQYIRENNLDAAQRQLEKAFAANSRYAPAYDMMGILLQQEGSKINLQKADGYFKKAIDMDKDFMQARNNYGVYLSQMGRYKEAMAQFEIAGATLGYEGRIGALENLGRTALKLGDKQTAMKAFIRALEANRNSVIAHIEMVDLLLDQKSYNQAQQMYDETLALLGKSNTSPRLLLQGIKLAAVHENIAQRQQLAQQLLSTFPLSEEAKLLKTWIRNPKAKAAWK